MTFPEDGEDRDKKRNKNRTNNGEAGVRKALGCAYANEGEQMSAGQL